MPRDLTTPEPIKVLDLFAGCGGLTQGFHRYRPDGADVPVFRSVGAVEWEPAAAASFAANFGGTSRSDEAHPPPEIFCRTIVDWTPPWPKYEVDVVVGGPPCQGFSGLNRHKVNAERNKLWQEFIRVVVAVQPRVFVIENVDRFVRSAEFGDLKERIGSGDLRNYRLVDPPGAKDGESSWDHDRRYLLNAADYGAPQARKRAIVMGVRTDGSDTPERMAYPTPTHSKDALDHAAELDGLDLPASLQPWLTVDDLFRVTSDLALVDTELPAGRGPVAVPVPGGTRLVAGPYLTSELHITRRPEHLSRARYAAVPPEGNRKDLRGRYLCRFRDGSELILERQGAFREGDRLLVNGRFAIVEDGYATARYVTVHSAEVAQELGSTGGRSKSELFVTEVRSDGRRRRATMEYLSTEAWDAHDAGSGDVMGRLRSGRPSVTVRTEFFKPEKGRYLHPNEDRPITHYEAAKLQGFPDSFQWCGSKTEIAKQIGNAVPVPLGESIAAAIYSYLRPAFRP